MSINSLLKRYFLYSSEFRKLVIKASVSKNVTPSPSFFPNNKQLTPHTRLQSNMGTVFSTLGNCCAAEQDEEERVTIVRTTNRIIDAVEKKDLEHKIGEVIKDVVDKCAQVVNNSPVGVDGINRVTSQELENVVQEPGASNGVIIHESPCDHKSSLEKSEECQPISVDETTKSAKRKTKGGTKRKSEKQNEEVVEKKSKRPNYFVAFRILNPQIHNNLERIQNHIIEQDERLANCMIPLPTLHITLGVMHIANVDDLSRAVQALTETYEEFNRPMSDHPLTLEFRGLGHFRNQVLFAKLSPGETTSRLNNVVEKVKQHFENFSISVTDKKEFSPHLTVMKLSRDPKIFRKGVRKINPALYKPYVDELFGSQVVESIQLLSMNSPKDADGYYQGKELLFEKKVASNNGD